MIEDQSLPRASLRGFSMSLPMSLLRARESVMQHFRAMLRSFGITEQQWRVLRALTAKDLVEFSELVEMTFLLAPSMSRILKELESRKLIARGTSNEDQRRVVVSITPSGLRLIEKVGAHSESIYAQISNQYGAKKLQTLQIMLRELEVAMSHEVFRPLSAAGKKQPGRANGRTKANRRASG